MIFTCSDCGHEAKSLRGWKAHMTRSHNGYTGEQVAILAERASSEQGAAASGFDSFEDAASAVSAGVVGQEVKEPKERKPRSSKAQKQASLELQARFTSMRSQFAIAARKIFDVILTQSMELDPMTEDESKAMQEALEFPLQILDVQFAVEPLNVNLTSFWWTLVVPFAMFATVAIGKAINSTKKGKQNVKSEKTIEGNGKREGAGGFEANAGTGL